MVVVVVVVGGGGGGGGVCVCVCVCVCSFCPLTPHYLQNAYPLSSTK